MQAVLANFARYELLIEMAQPLVVAVSQDDLTGLSRSRIYELIQSGDLETSKVGRATLISYQSLKRLVQN